jgi:formylglycine-generating enzyme required for sulfatase activity/serine/threonine protein kinase
MNEETLFAEAIAIESPEERRRFLDSACGGNAELRQGVEKLLSLTSDAGSFLEHPPADLTDQPDATVLSENGSESTQDDGVETEDFVPGEHDDMTAIFDDSSDEIPLGYRQSSSRADAIGRLAHYEILEVVGRGAFGTVLRAFDEKLQRVVAIKVLAPEMASTSPARKRFLREARTSAAIRHENVVGIHAVEDDPIPYLVMEYIPGKTLQQRLDEHGPLDLTDVLTLGKQIADGLAAAHGEELIHRDIKPGNILLEGGMDERVKITDFGLARTADDASMTQSGMIAGTPQYMAPEQAQGHKLDQRADLFSLGSVLYQMLTGRPPFRAPNTVAVLRRVVDDVPRPMQEIIPEIPTWMSDLVSHLHAKHPDERYQTAKEISDLLAQCLEDLKAGREPKIPDPLRAGGESTEITAVVGSESIGPRRESRRLSPLVKVATTVVILLGVLGITEATGVTKLASTIIRLTTTTGTLVIETDDPRLKVSVDGDNVRIHGSGLGELTLKPGQSKVAALKDGKPVKQELVSIERNDRTVVLMTLEPTSTSLAGTRSDSQPSTLNSQPTGWNAWPADAPPPAIAPFDAEQAEKHQEAWAKYLGVPVEKEIVLGQDKAGKDVKLTMVLIPPGEFMMGSTDEEQLRAVRRRDAHLYGEIYSEAPQHRVRITRPFWLGRHEITIAEFRQFVESERYVTEAERDPEGGTGFPRGKRVQSPRFVWSGDLEFAQSEDSPVVSISWNDAAAFCKWLSRTQGDLTCSLPSEARWEYACRAGTTTDWYAGNSMADVQEYGWFSGNSELKTHPVGQLRPNGFGLYDMHGNVWEWCGDWYGTSYYETSPINDPTGPLASDSRVRRGGSWFNGVEPARSAKRLSRDPNYRDTTTGFRVAAAISEDVIQAAVDRHVKANQFQWPADAPPPAIAPFDAGQAKAHQEAWAKYLGVPVEQQIVIGEDAGGEDVALTIVLVPPGEFLMGSNVEEQAELSDVAEAVDDRWLAGRISSEGPQHRVRITRPFYLGKYEVTQGQWQAVMGTNPSQFQDAPMLPVEQVNWDDSQDFLTKLSDVASATKLKFSLPTEAQWEYACRAGTTTYWYYGDSEKTLSQYCWFGENADGRTHPVGRLKPNAWGLHDMYGNVLEWCADQYSGTYYAESQVNDPAGPSAHSHRSDRGGCIDSKTWHCRSASRPHSSSKVRGGNLGFRLAADLPVDVLRAKLTTSAQSEPKNIEPFQSPADDPSEATLDGLKDEASPDTPQS